MSLHRGRNAPHFGNLLTLYDLISRRMPLRVGGMSVPSISRLGSELSIFVNLTLEPQENSIAVIRLGAVMSQHQDRRTLQKSRVRKALRNDPLRKFLEKGAKDRKITPLNH